MPRRVLLRGFTPDIPEEQPVTFCEDLPPNITCSQCDNVSAVLHRDPSGHGYCASCLKMCTDRDSFFDCPECARQFHLSELKEDRSVPEIIRGRKVICPNSAQGRPVYINFSALKDHLKQHSCGQTVHDEAVSDRPGSVQVSKTSLTESASENFQDDIQLLTVTVQAVQEDVMNVQIQCHQRIQEIEKAISNLKLKEELSQRDGIIASLMAYVQANQEDIRTLKEQLSERDLSIASLTTNTRAYQEDMRKLKEELSRRDFSVASLKLSAQMDQEDLKKLREDLHERDDCIASLRATVKSNQEDVKKLKEELSQRDDSISSLRACFQRGQDELRQELSSRDNSAASLTANSLQNEEVVSKLKEELSERDAWMASLTTNVHINEEDTKKLIMELSQRNANIEFLTSTLQTLQDSVRNAHLQWEKRIETVERASSALQTSLNSLQQTLYANKQEAHAEIHTVHEALKKTSDHFSAVFNQLQINSQQSRCSMEQWAGQLHQLRTEYSALQASYQNLMAWLRPHQHGQHHCHHTASGHQ
ncbi:uncharacterized protein LOC144104305 [Amblyomma americanum]